MSHHKHLDSPLMKLEQYLFSYGRAAAQSHPAGSGNLQGEPDIILPPRKEMRRNASLATGPMEH